MGMGMGYAHGLWAMGYGHGLWECRPRRRTEKRGDATTEEMRRAINHYEKLFEELVSETGEADSTDGFVPGVRLDDAGDHDHVLR